MLSVFNALLKGCINVSVEIANKMQPCNRIYYSSVYWKLTMFRAAYRSSSGAPNCICSLWFTYTCGDRPLSSLSGKFPTQTWQRPVTTYVCKPEAANTVWSSWWWAVCPSKHGELSVNAGIINSITRLHLVGYFYWYIRTAFEQRIKNTQHIQLLWISMMMMMMTTTRTTYFSPKISLTLS